MDPISSPPGFLLPVLFHQLKSTSAGQEGHRTVVSRYMIPSDIHLTIDYTDISTINPMG